MNTTELPAEQRTVLEGLAGSGDEEAKGMLADLPQPKAPANEEPKAEEKAGDAPTSEPKAQGQEGQESGRERDGQRHKPSKIEDIRKLRQARRELQAELAAERQRNADFAKRLEAIEKRGPTPAQGADDEKPDADDLTNLLTKPGEYLSAREKRLLDQVKSLVEEKFGVVPKLISQWNTVKSEQSQAFETLKTTKDFDLKAFDRGEYDDEIYELMEEKHGFTEDMVDEFFKTRPTWMAARVKQAWENRTSIDPKARAAKAAASSGSGSGTPKSGSGVQSLEDLNRQFKLAKTPEEQDRILAEIDKMSMK